MLLEFSVENFKSFKERTTLKMTSSDGKPLNVAIFMGANASGKSNFLKAMYASSKFIRRGTIDEFDAIDICDKFVGGRKRNTSFEYIFSQNKNIIKYSFSIGCTNGVYNVDEEKLLIGDSIQNLEEIYIRANKNIDLLYSNKDSNLYTRINAVRENFSNMGDPGNVLFVSILLGQIDETSDEIKEIKSFFDIFNASDIGAVLNIGRSVFSILKDKEKRNNFLNFVRMADNSISDFKILEALDKPKTIDSMTHTINGKEKVIRFSHESGGVRAFASLFYMIDKIKSSKSIYVIDELDSKLHYDLLSVIVEMIDKNKLGSQIIFSCHNVGALYWNIKNGCFNIVEKEDGISTILRANEKLKDDLNIDKRIEYYFKGKLGGFPDYEILKEKSNSYFENK